MQDYLISRFNSFSLDTKGLTVDNLLERSKKNFQYFESSDTLVVCLPGWGQNLWSWGRLRRHIIGSGFSLLTYEFPQHILSNDRQLTKGCFEMINKIVRKDIEELKDQYNFSQCVVVGVSLASSFSSLVYKGNQDITDIIFIAPGENLAREVWHGCRTQHLRRSFEKQNISLGQLEECWRELASENNMPAKNTKVTLYLAGKDQVIPSLCKNLIAVLERGNFKPNSRVYKGYGHYLLILKFLLFPSHFIRLTPREI